LVAVGVAAVQPQRIRPAHLEDPTIMSIHLRLTSEPSHQASPGLLVAAALVLAIGAAAALRLMPATEAAPAIPQVTSSPIGVEHAAGGPRRSDISVPDASTAFTGPETPPDEPVPTF
jgi:hypothetical protein